MSKKKSEDPESLKDAIEKSSDAKPAQPPPENIAGGAGEKAQSTENQSTHSSRFSLLPTLSLNPEPAPAEIDRLLTLALHEEQMLSERINIFLLSESLFLAIYFSDKALLDSSLTHIIIWFGIFISIIWLFSNVRQHDDLRSAAFRLRNAWSELRIIDKSVSPFLKASSLFLTVYILPAAFGIMWGYLLFA